MTYDQIIERIDSLIRRLEDLLKAAKKAKKAIQEMEANGYPEPDIGFNINNAHWKVEDAQESVWHIGCESRKAAAKDQE